MKRQLAMHSATTGTLGVLETIEVARVAQFDALEIDDDKLSRHVASGGTLDDVRAALARSSLEPISLTTREPLALPRGTDDVPALARTHEALCERAAVVGCRIIVIRPPRPLEKAMPKVWHDTATRTLASVSRAAAEYGITVALEFVGTGSSTVRTLAEGREMVGEPSPPIGLVLDAFQFYAGASTWAMLDTLDTSTVSIVRLNDAEKLPLEDLTAANRMLPGDGVVPMRELLRRIESAGYRGPYSIQLERPDYWDWEPRRLARVAHESIEAVCAEKDEQEGLLEYD